jgi:hypothetical protein
VARRRLAGRPVPAEVIDLDRQLRIVSETGHQSGQAATELVPDLVGPAEAAEIIGCSVRHARRLAADLNGTHCGSHWIFRRQTVVDYAEAKGEGNGCNRQPDSGGGAIPA